jgi:hypothetical protein
MPPETLGSRPGSVATGRDREVRGATHNWPSVVRVWSGLVGRDILASSHTSDSCGGPGAVHANQGRQVHSVSSDTLVRLASGMDAHCVKKRVWLQAQNCFFWNSSVYSCSEKLTVFHAKNCVNVNSEEATPGCWPSRRVPLSSVCVLLPILIFSFYWPVWCAFSFQLCLEGRSRLFTVYVDTGVLRVLFNEAVRWGLVRLLFLKLDTLMYLSSCSVVHRGLPLLFLFWLERVCAVLW